MVVTQGNRPRRLLGQPRRTRHPTDAARGCRLIGHCPTVGGTGPFPSSTSQRRRSSVWRTRSATTGMAYRPPSPTAGRATGLPLGGTGVDGRRPSLRARVLRRGPSAKRPSCRPTGAGSSLICTQSSTSATGGMTFTVRCRTSRVAPRLHPRARNFPPHRSQHMTGPR